MLRKLVMSRLPGRTFEVPRNLDHRIKQMASVSGSRLAFVSPNEKPVNLILSDGQTVTESTVRGAFNIEIFTAGSGTALPGVAGTATIDGAVKVSGSVVQAGSLDSTEQLGFGKFTMIDQTGGENITLGTGAQTVIGSSGDTITGGDAGKAQQVIDLTGTNSHVVSGPMTAIGGAGRLLVEAGDFDSIAGGSGGTKVVGISMPSREDDEDDDHPRGGDTEGDEDHGNNRRGGGGDKHDDDDDKHHAGATVATGDTITGGSGPMTVDGGTNDSITGGTGRLFVEEVTSSTINAGTGGTTVTGGNMDQINDTVGGTLTVDILSRSRTHGHSSVAGSGEETVDLGAAHLTTTLRDISVRGGTGGFAETTVMGFTTPTDLIASKTSVSRGRVSRNLVGFRRRYDPDLPRWFDDEAGRHHRHQQDNVHPVAGRTGPRRLDPWARVTLGGPKAAPSFMRPARRSRETAPGQRHPLRGRRRSTRASGLAWSRRRPSLAPAAGPRRRPSHRRCRRRQSSCSRTWSCCSTLARSRWPRL
ncbi:MAG TPA: hypothetical protein VHO95_06935 [Candidatus Dormibacteraeota bacterium]|nr:hypothetical protein [Candidatus Dormibacteraeota bacterium]